MPSGSLARESCSTFLLRGVNKKSISISNPPAAGSRLDAQPELKNPEARLNLRFSHLLHCLYFTSLRSKCFLMPSNSVVRKSCSNFILRGVNKKSISIPNPPAAGSRLDARAELENLEARLNLRFRTFFIFFLLSQDCHVCVCVRVIRKKKLNASKPSEPLPFVKILDGKLGCRDKNSSWYQKGSSV